MPSSLTAAMRRKARAEERLRRAKLGPPLSLTSADLEVVSNVGPTDQAEAKAFVRATAGERGVAMLEAG